MAHEIAQHNDVLDAALKQTPLHFLANTMFERPPGMSAPLPIETNPINIQATIDRGIAATPALYEERF